MHTKLKLFSLISVFIILLVAGCKKKDSETPTPDTGIVGTWTVTKVNGEVSVAGLNQSDTDNSPKGTVAFLSNDTGATAYSFTLFSVPYGDTGTFKWTKDDSSITVTRQDGTVETWKILSSSGNRMEAEFTRTFSNNIQAKLQVTLTK